MEIAKKVGILSFSLIVKTFVSLAVVKLAAVYLGVDKFGLTGQITSLINIITLVSGCGVYLGVAKYFANDSRCKEGEILWIGSSIILILLSSFLLIFILTIYKNYIIINIFNNYIYSDYIIILLIIATPIFGITSLGTGIINGFHFDNLYYKAISIGSIFGLIGACLLITTGEKGVILSIIWLSLSQSIAIILMANKVLKIEVLKIKIDKNIIKELINYGSLALIAGIIIPISIILIRTYVQKTNGDFSMGILQAIYRLSESYTQLPMILISSYYYPRFSNRDSFKASKLKIAFFHTMMIMIIISLVIYSFRENIIKLIYTTDFIEVNNYLLLQLIGDIFKILAFLGATFMMARGYIRLCNFGTLFHSMILVLISCALIDNYGLMGAVIGNLINYFLYLLVIFIIIYKYEKINILDLKFLRNV